MKIDGGNVVQMHNNIGIQTNSFFYTCITEILGVRGKEVGGGGHLNESFNFYCFLTF